MKRIAISSALLCTTLSASAQSINYKVVNRTDSLSPIKMSTVVELRNLFIAAGAGLMAEGVVLNRLSYSARYVKFFTSSLVLAKDKLPGNANLDKGSNLELGAEWYFSSKEISPRRVKVVTSSSGGYGSYYTERYFNAKLPRRRIFLLRAGMSMLNLPTYVGAGNSYHFTVGADSLVAPSDYTYYSNTRTTAFYGGIGYRKLYKAKVKADGWGYFKWKSWKMYVDVLTASLQYGPVMDAAGRTHTNVGLSNNSSLGYRLGMEEEMNGMVTNIEIGKWPGNSGPYSFYNYLNLSFRFNIWGGDKKYRLKGR